MITVTANYLAEIIKPVITTDVSIEITLTDSTTLILSGDDLKIGNFTTSNKCVNGSELMTGSVYAGQLDFVFNNPTLDRYKLYNAIVKPFNSLWIPATSTWEKIQMGEYKIIEALRIEQYISVSSIDNMTKLDVDVLATFNGTPWEILSYIALQLPTIVYAQTQEQIEALPNGTANLSLNRLDKLTYRDVLGYLASVFGCFVYCDNTGKIKFKPFSITSNFTVPRDLRYHTEIADFDVNYTRLTTKIAGKIFTATADPDDGMLFTLPDNVLIELGLDGVKQEIIDNIFSAINAITYTPIEISCRMNPALELGDMITIQDKNGVNYTSVITEYVFNYRGKSRITSVGANPHLGSVSEKSDKDFNNSIQQAISVGILFTNASDKEVNATPRLLGQIQFSEADIEALPMLHAVVKLALTVPGIVNFYYYINDVIQPFIHSVYMHEGIDTATLMYPLSNLSSIVSNTIKVYMQSDVAEGEVSSGDFLGVILGSGIVSTYSWDGTIFMEDQYTIMGYKILGTNLIDDTLEVTIILPETVEVAVSYDPMEYYNVMSFFLNGLITLNGTEDWYEDTTTTPTVNNLIEHSNFDATTGFTGSDATLTVSDNKMNVIGEGTGRYPQLIKTMLFGSIGDKVYFKIRARVDNSDCQNIYLMCGDTVLKNQSTPIKDEWYTLNGIRTLEAETEDLICVHQYADGATSSGKVMQVEYLFSGNLTIDFTAGNEPAQAIFEDWLWAFNNAWFDSDVSKAWANYPYTYFTTIITAVLNGRAICDHFVFHPGCHLRVNNGANKEFEQIENVFWFNTDMELPEFKTWLASILPKVYYQKITGADISVLPYNEVVSMILTDIYNKYSVLNQYKHEELLYYTHAQLREKIPLVL